MDNYSQKHREKIREYNKNYYQKHKEYSKKDKERRMEERVYREAGEFINKKLYDLNKNQLWFAKELGVTKEAVSKYVMGVYFPRGVERRKKLCRILKIKFSDLENILKQDY